MASWESDLLSVLGAPHSQTNIEALQYWAVSEGVPTSWNNWLATTYDGYGGRNVNSVGVKAYPTQSDGAHAIAATITNGRYNALVLALLEGDSITRVYDAINDSPWCGGCQGGHYPIALYNFIHGGNRNFPQQSPSAPLPPAKQATPNRNKVGDAWHDYRYYYTRGVRDQIDNADLLTTLINHPTK